MAKVGKVGVGAHGGGLSRRGNAVKQNASDEKVHQFALLCETANIASPNCPRNKPQTSPVLKFVVHFVHILGNSFRFCIRGALLDWRKGYIASSSTKVLDIK